MLLEKKSGRVICCWNVDHYKVVVTVQQEDGEMCEDSEMNAKDN